MIKELNSQSFLAMADELPKYEICVKNTFLHFGDEQDWQVFSMTFLTWLSGGTIPSHPTLVSRLFIE